MSGLWWLLTEGLSSRLYTNNCLELLARRRVLLSKSQDPCFDINCNEFTLFSSLKATSSTFIFFPILIKVLVSKSNCGTLTIILTGRKQGRGSSVISQHHAGPTVSKYHLTCSIIHTLCQQLPRDKNLYLYDCVWFSLLPTPATWFLTLHRWLSQWLVI